MGPAADEALRLGLAVLRLSQHTEDIRTLPATQIFYFYLRCDRRRSLPVGDDCENFPARLSQRRESVLQVPLVRLRQLHGAHNLGVDCAAGAGDSRDCAALLIAVDSAVTAAFDYDPLPPGVP